jgi:hypothetical protein
MLLHRPRRQPLISLHIVVCLPLPPHPPSYALRTRSARVRRRTRGQNRSPNLLEHNLTVLHTIGCRLHLERGPWSRVQKNLQRRSDDRSVRVRLATKLFFPLLRIMNVSEQGVCLLLSPLRSQPWLALLSPLGSKHVNILISHSLTCPSLSLIRAYIYSLYLIFPHSLHPPRT